MTGVELGTRYDIDPIPPEDANTTYFDAGPLRIGVEYRLLDDAILGEAFAADPGAAAVIDAAKPAVVDDQGFSIHVFGVDDGGERLRFDLFDGDPHYHYIVPGSHNLLIAYDQAAFGPMVPWAIECLRSRLPQMLRVAEAPQLADAVDQAAVDAILPDIEAIAAGARPAHI
jgi:hypothetical protein